MATLHIPNVPDELYDCILQLTEEQQRFIEKQVILLLEHSIAEAIGRQDQAKILARIHERRMAAPPMDGAPNSVTLLREDRER